MNTVETIIAIVLMGAASIWFPYQYFRTYKTQPIFGKVFLGICALLTPVLLILYLTNNL